jgi:intracellular septation protein
MEGPHETGPEAPRRPLLRLLIEVGPLVLFFLVNSRWKSIAPGSELESIYPATAVFMVAILISLGASWLTERRVPTMPLVTAFFVLVFGGLTLALQDELFIKLKPTIVNSLFAVILFAGLFAGRSLLKPLLDTAIDLTEEGWRVLTLRWAFFFVFLAVLNEVVWRGFSTDFWVSFKVFGVMPITLVFLITQAPLIQRHTRVAEPALEEEPPPARVV